jgi:hypothetical protein
MGECSRVFLKTGAMTGIQRSRIISFGSWLGLYGEDQLGFLNTGALRLSLTGLVDNGGRKPVFLF